MGVGKKSWILVVTLLLSLFTTTPAMSQTEEDTFEPFFELVQMYGEHGDYLRKLFQHIGIDYKVIGTSFVEADQRQQINGSYQDGGYDLILAGNLFQSGPISPQPASSSGYDEFFELIMNNHYSDPEGKLLQKYINLHNYNDTQPLETRIAELSSFLYEELLFIPLNMERDRIMARDDLTFPEGFLSNYTRSLQDYNGFTTKWSMLDLEELNIAANIRKPWRAHPELTGPQELTANDQNLNIAALVFQPLYEYQLSSDLAWEPVLASSLPQISNDGLIITVPLRENITFADGNEFNATSVELSYNRWLNHIGYGVYNETIESVTVIDPLTVQFQLNQTTPHFMQLLKLLIVPAHIWNPTPTDDDVFMEWIYNLFDIYDFGVSDWSFGTGPFVLSNITGHPTLGNITLTKNPYYWQEGMYLEQINILNYYGRYDVAVDDLISGNIDIIHDSLLGNIIEVPQTLAIFEASRPQQLVLQVNLNHPIIGTGELTPLGLEDPTQADQAAKYVRKAISAVFDRDRVHSIYSIGTNQTYLNAYENSDLNEVHSNITSARKWMEMAGYSYLSLDTITEDTVPESFVVSSLEQVEIHTWNFLVWMVCLPYIKRRKLV